MKEAHSTLALCDRAAALLRSVGFELRNCSMKSEACYYALPGCKALLRVATHRFRGPRSIKKTDVVAKLTFNDGGPGVIPGHMRLAETKFRQLVEGAIGRYMIEAAKHGEPVAQRIERSPSKRQVAGSNPAGPMTHPRAEGR